MEKSKKHIDKQKAFECRAIQPVLESLKINESFVDYDGERPDIRFKYDGKNIGVEVIDCYPSKFDINTHKSVEKFCKDIENTLSAKGLCGEYNLYLKDSIYNVKINDIRHRPDRRFKAVHVYYGITYRIIIVNTNVSKFKKVFTAWMTDKMV